jgi:hypothetical protein
MTVLPPLWDEVVARDADAPVTQTSGRSAIYASQPHRYGFGGIVAEHGIQRADVDAVLATLAAERALRISIRPNPVHAPAWDGDHPRWLRVARSAQVVDVRDGADSVWTRRAEPRAGVAGSVAGARDSLERWTKIAALLDGHPYAELRHESLPISTVDARARTLVKRAISFRGGELTL